MLSSTRNYELLNPHLPHPLAKSFDDFVQFLWFAGAPAGWLLANNDVSIHVGMDDVAIYAALHLATNSHQAVLL